MNSPKIIAGLTWLVVIPAGVWAVATVYVPIMGNLSNPSAAWLVALLIVVLAGGSLLAHLAAHRLVASLTGSELPRSTALFIFGEASQSWPASPSVAKELVGLAAGPVLNLVLAGVAYLVWNAQLNDYLNLSTLFICFFNLWLAGVNLAPVFPFDGGRVSRIILHAWSGRPASATRMVRRMGFLVIAVQAAWGIVLIVPQYQYSWQTGLTTLFFAVLFLVAMVGIRPWDWPSPVSLTQPAMRLRPLGLLASGLVVLALFIAPVGLLMTNDGIDAPGVALSVEPMVQVPSQYFHAASGTFILTSVLSQSPVPILGWASAKLLPTVALIPPQKAMPDQPSAQETAQQGFQMLDESEITAEVVGLQLAGYPAKIVGKGVSVNSVLTYSPSQGILLPGDIITAVNGVSVQTAGDLSNQIQAQSGQSSVTLQITRAGKALKLDIPLIPPTAPGDTPKIGITIQTAGFEYQLPFDVQIIPQKIVGGPSAGLMFTLTLYNLLTPGDLTRGYIIAGTGTINPDGTVGPIGGVKQKVAAAEAAGAEYFLAPAQDYPDAVLVARSIKVIEIATASQAIQFLEGLPPRQNTP